MYTAEYWIQKLQLKQHPEGGFYSETYKSNERLTVESLPRRYKSDHSFGTAIYFLLRSHDISAFHKIKSDELWFFHAGSPVEIVFLTEDGTLTTTLGLDFEKGQRLQALIPFGTWFGAKVKEPNSFTLVSCTVSPGFEFEDFELAGRDALLQEFPKNKEAVLAFTRA